ncbi:MAG: hypothetical protein M3Q69_13400 [Acidobacteriota bacterium]|nr:hypothetical protein [Acidobacteriota bacterium]
MRAGATFLALCFLAASAVAQEQQPQKSDPPDYSRGSLMRIFSTTYNPDDDGRKLHIHDGAIEFRALGTTWRFLPAMLPLSGSVPRTTQEWPDPFALTHTSIATSKRAWRTDRQRRAELRRIERTEKEKRAKLKVTTKK